MSQEEIIEVLRKENRPLSRTEIAKILNSNPIVISHAIRCLLKHKEIKCMEIDRKQAMEKYHCKQRIRIYYV